MSYEDAYGAELENIERRQRQQDQANQDLIKLDILKLAGVRSSRKRLKR